MEIRRVLLALPALVTAGSALAFAATGAPVAPPGTPQGCPLSDRAAVVSGRPGADASLVPAGATKVLVCSYSGFSQPAPLPNQSPRHRLIGDGSVTDGGSVTQLADELDAIAPTPPGTSIACPADFGNQLVAYFRYPSGAEDPVTVGLSGCQAITNGRVNRLGLQAPVISELAQDAAPAILSGRVQVCGGPAPGGCRTETAGSCGPGPGSCSRTDRVAILVRDGARLVTVPLRHARFSAYVPGGRYKLELLAGGKHVHEKVVQAVGATAHSGRTTRVVFRISVP